MEKVELNKDVKLSQHFLLGELCKTSVKTAGNNIPSHVAIENLRNLCENWLEELRENYNLIYEGVGDCKGDEPGVCSGYPMCRYRAGDSVCVYPAGYRGWLEARLR